MSKTSRIKLSKERWEYLKKLHPSKGKYIHTSVKAGMVIDPRGKEFPPIPMVMRPGDTYNVGRNKAKREKKSNIGQNHE